MSTKVSIYLSKGQKEQLVEYAKAENLSLSQYLVQHGLNKKVQSNSAMAGIASIACQLYSIADSTSDNETRAVIRKIGGQIYGLFEDKAP